MTSLFFYHNELIISLMVPADIVYDPTRSPFSSIRLLVFRPSPAKVWTDSLKLWARLLKNTNSKMSSLSHHFMKSFCYGNSHFLTCRIFSMKLSGKEILQHFVVCFLSVYSIFLCFTDSIT